MYDNDDPRSALRAIPEPVALDAPRPAEYVILSDSHASDGRGKANSWHVRGQNVVIEHASLGEGDSIDRAEQPDEYMVLAPDATTRLRVITADGVRDVGGGTLLVVPPGPSRITALTAGPITCLYSTKAEDLTRICSNADSYLEPRRNVAPFGPWPDPPGGFRLRAYPLAVPDEPGRFGRIWRCTTLMINVFAAQYGPRDPQKLSPHVHDDFEQLSIGLAGDYVHHLRWPWSADRTVWRDDEHVRCPSPSITIIPPTVIHTTEAVGSGFHQLIDVFSPPRLDFSRQPGWVLNADDYPTPIEVSDQSEH